MSEYVAEIREKDWKKCWPFGLCDPNKLDAVFVSEFQDSTFLLPSLKRPREDYALNHTLEHAESTPKYLKAPLEIDDEICKPVCNGSLEPTSSKVKIGQCQNEKSVDDHEPGRNQTRRRPQKFLLLSDILRELSGPSGGHYVCCDSTNTENVNTRFATETEDDSDDNVTLGTLFRKQKGRDRFTRVLKKKKMKMIRVEKDKGSTTGFKDGQVKTRIADVDIQMDSKRKIDTLITLKDSSRSNRYVEEATETGKEDSEMEAVMLLARHFNGAQNPSRPGPESKKGQTVHFVNQSADPGPGQRLTTVNISNKNTEPACACVQKKIRESSTHKDPVLYAKTHKNLNKEKLADGFFSVSMAGQPHMEIYLMKACTINRNPADFTILNAGNKFMRGG